MRIVACEVKVENGKVTSLVLTVACGSDKNSCGTGWHRWSAMPAEKSLCVYEILFEPFKNNRAHFGEFFVAAVEKFDAAIFRTAILRV